ncbi:unnamed protein product [Cutaneotrichosporon oleaginosum]
MRGMREGGEVQSAAVDLTGQYPLVAGSWVNAAPAGEEGSGTAYGAYGECDRAGQIDLGVGGSMMACRAGLFTMGSDVPSSMGPKAEDTTLRGVTGEEDRGARRAE